MKFVKIITIPGGYRATVKEGNNENDLVVVETIDTSTENEVQTRLLSHGFHQQDIFSALAEATGKSVNAAHPLFEEALASKQNRGN